jgi:peptidoglycan/xylan/chitin deacetylase (PgdA/CDA1 family)
VDDKHAWIGTAARRLGGGYLASRLIPPAHVRIAMSHHVFEEDFEQFDRILRALGTEREFIEPQQFFRHYAKAAPDPIVGKSLLWTFDDGLFSAYNTAQQVLNPLGMKALFFVPTAILDFRTHEQMREFAHARVLFGTRPLHELRPEEYVTMSAEHLQTLHEQGHMILPHTHSHVLARDITTPEDVNRELTRPKLILEDLLQSRADAVAIPVGTPSTVSTYSYRQIALVYFACFTALGGANTQRTDPRFLRRDSIHPWYSVDHARSIVDGMFDPYFQARMAALYRRAGGKYLSASGKQAAERDAAALPRTAKGRGRFVAQVADAFERAGVDYVFLHGYEEGRGADSDLDVAVARDSLERTDRLIRSGIFGRVVQCLHHGVPWCRYYVFEVDEPGRRYRQLDVVCDPWGIGQDGPAVPVALSSAVLCGNMRVPQPAAESLYLAVKRARKRRHDLHDLPDLARVFERDAEGAARLLERHFGVAGVQLANGLERRKPDLTEELEALRRQLVRQRRSPEALTRRVIFDAPRVMRRLLRATGLAVCIVGPEAERKSLAAELERETDGVFRRSTLLRSGHRLQPAPPVRPTSPERSEQQKAPTTGAVGAIAEAPFRWPYGLARWPSVALGRARASLVIVEAGWPEIAIGARPYQTSRWPWVIELLGRVLPRPDLTLFLDRPMRAGCEANLDVGQTDRPLEIAAHLPPNFVVIHGSRSAETTLELALMAIDDRLAARQALQR